MQCYNCGAENDENNQVCYNCGTQLYAYEAVWNQNDEDNMQNSYVGSKNTKPIIIGVVAGGLVLILAVVACCVILNFKTPERQYQEKLAEAVEYVTTGNYEMAIEVYKEAIAINDKDPESYIGIAQAYEGLGDYLSAITWLRTGYDKTGDVAINDLLTKYINFTSEKEETVDVMAELTQEDMAAIELNNRIFDELINSTYGTYTRDYGDATIVEQTTNEVKISFDKLGGYVCFENTSSKKFDSATGKPMVDATGSYITFTDLSKLFPNMQSGITAGRLQELFGTTFDVITDDDRCYIMVEYNNCLVKIETDEAGNLISKSAWNQIVPADNQNQDNSTNQGVATGQIINASTGVGISGVKLTVHKGPDSPYGEVIKELESDGHGNYSIELSEGKYTITAAANGFVDESFTISVMRGMTVANQNLTMSEELKIGEIRIVLEWGSEPSDLDAHLVGTSANGTYVNVNFTNKVATENGTMIASLDVDDQSAYGPETITVTDGAKGNYEFFVHNYSGMAQDDSFSLAESGATVKVYIGGQEPRVFNVPVSSGGIAIQGFYWHVFRLDQGVITEINEIDWN